MGQETLTAVGMWNDYEIAKRRTDSCGVAAVGLEPTSPGWCYYWGAVIPLSSPRPGLYPFELRRDSGLSP